MTLPRLVLQDRVMAMREELRKRPTEDMGRRSAWNRRLAALVADVEALAVPAGQVELTWVERQEQELARLAALVEADRLSEYQRAEIRRAARAEAERIKSNEPAPRWWELGGGGARHE